MASKTLTTAQSRDYDISQCIVISNDQKNKIDISTAISDLYYYESILGPHIKVDLTFVDSGKSVKIS